MTPGYPARCIIASYFDYSTLARAHVSVRTGKGGSVNQSCHVGKLENTSPSDLLPFVGSYRTFLTTTGTGLEELVKLVALNQ
jgi:hypothetical protein